MANKNIPLRRVVCLLLFFVACIGMFFYRVVLGEVIYCCDNFLINIPAKVYWVRMIQNGIVPLWNPYILSGVPFLADINLALLYPFNMLYLLLSPFRALTVDTLMHVFLALAGMFMLGHSFGLSAIASAAAAVVFGFSGTMIVYTNNVPMIHVAALVPWVVWSWRKLWIHLSLLRLVSFVFFASLQLVAGHPQPTYLTWVWLLLYLFCIVRYPWRRTLIWVLAAGAGVFSVSAVQLLPFFEFVLHSTRGRGEFSYASFGSMNPLAFVRLFLPAIAGDMSHGTAWIFGGSVYGYIGTLPMFIALVGMRRKKEVRFLWCVVIMSFLLALGKFTPIFRLAYMVLPGLGLFRSPEHFLLLYTFSFALLVGFGLDALDTARRKRFVRWAQLIGGVAVSSGFLVWLGREELLGGIGSLPGIGSHINRKLALLPVGATPLVLKSIIINLFVIGVVWLLCSFFLRIREKNVWRKALFVILLSLELFLFSRYHLVTVPYESVSMWLHQARVLAEAVSKGDTNTFRIWTDVKAYPSPFLKRAGQSDWTLETAWQAQIMRPNVNMVFTVASVDGYSALIPTAYQQFLGGSAVDPTSVTIDGPSRFDLLGVASTIEASQGAIFVSPRPLASPRAFLLNLDMKKIEGVHFKSFTPNTITLTTSATIASRLVLSDALYPGWSVFIDGKKAPLEAYEGYLKSTHVPPGTHHIWFLYRPLSIMIGFWISVGGIVFCLVCVLFGIRQKRSSFVSGL